tara:strand:- start:128 stop:286 length:159 start_codon:yes stop_codon:yes gene_type:complete
MDLAKDSDELRNYYNVERYGTIATRLRNKLKQLLIDIEDPVLNDPEINQWFN